jgi:hypothetical protein
MITQQFDKFQSELVQLLARYSAGTYFFSCVVNDSEGELSDLPIMAEVSGDRERNVSRARVASVLVEHLLQGLIRLLMQHCGLSLHQAYGAVLESTKAAAHDLQQEQEKFLRQVAAAEAQGVGT